MFNKSRILQKKKKIVYCWSHEFFNGSVVVAWHIKRSLCLLNEDSSINKWSNCQNSDQKIRWRVCLPCHCVLNTPNKSSFLVHKEVPPNYDDMRQILIGLPHLLLLLFHRRNLLPSVNMKGEREKNAGLLHPTLLADTLIITFLGPTLISFMNSAESKKFLPAKLSWLDEFSLLIFCNYKI